MTLLTTGGTVALAQIDTSSVTSVIETVEELRAAAAVGGVHILSAASFLLDEPLVVSRDLTLYGADLNILVAADHDADSAPALPSIIRVRWAAAGIIVTEGARVRIGGIHFDGVVSGTIRSDGTRDSGDGLDLIRVLDGRFEVARSVFSRARLGPIEEGRRYGRGSGIFVTGSASALIVDSVFIDNRLAAVETVGKARVEVHNSIFASNLNGVLVEDDGLLGIYSSTFKDHPASALILRGASRSVVSDSTLRANGASPDSGQTASDGVRIGNLANVTLTGNSFLDSPRYAVSVYGRGNVISEGNLFAGNGGYIETEDQVRSALIVEDEGTMRSTRDAFVDNPGGAIEVFGDARFELIEAEVRGNGSGASIYMSDDVEVRISGALVAENQGSVVAVGDARVTVQGGTYTSTRTDAFYLGGRAELSLSSSEIRDNRGFGVAAGDDARAEIDGAVVTGNRDGGISFLENASGYVINTHFGGNAAGRALVYRLDADVRVEGNSTQ
ncbi:MAG: right-handed parallel beta-helix repeat-containing protein [Trueperaceae bacterium]|nr:right-handed parallel beta-helix repeat-containing protein [Trueperaceae bacterium]